MKEGKRKELSVLRVLHRENTSMIKPLSPHTEQGRENKVDVYVTALRTCLGDNLELKKDLKKQFARMPFLPNSCPILSSRPCSSP